MHVEENSIRPFTELSKINSDLRDAKMNAYKSQMPIGNSSRFLRFQESELTQKVREMS